MKIALIYGGKSCEHDISVITACQIAHSLKNHELYRIYADRQNKWWLIEGDYTPRQHLFLKPKKRAYFKTGESVLYVKNGCFVKKNTHRRGGACFSRNKRRGRHGAGRVGACGSALHVGGRCRKRLVYG